MKKYTFRYEKDGEPIEYNTTDHVKAMGIAAALVTNQNFSLEISEYNGQPEYIQPGTAQEA